MIGEAVDTVLTLGWALAAHDAVAVPAYLAATVAVAGLLCGHQGQPWPLRGLCARLTAELAARAPGLLRARVRPPDGRVRLRAARVPGSASGATAPSRRTGPRWAASRADAEGFPAPATPRPSQGRSETSNHQEAA